MDKLLIASVIVILLILFISIWFVFLSTKTSNFAISAATRNSTRLDKIDKRMKSMGIFTPKSDDTAMTKANNYDTTATAMTISYNSDDFNVCDPIEEKISHVKNILLENTDNGEKNIVEYGDFSSSDDNVFDVNPGNSNDDFTSVLSSPKIGNNSRYCNLRSSNSNNSEVGIDSSSRSSTTISMVTVSNNMSDVKRMFDNLPVVGSDCI